MLARRVPGSDRVPVVVRIIPMVRWSLRCVFWVCGCLSATLMASAQESPQAKWSYSPSALRPFWEGTVVEGESVLFIRDAATGEAKASTLFPIRKVLAVRDASGRTTYEEGRDYRWKADSRELVLPAGSRITSRTAQELRRPAKSQKYELTHRDGNGEIFFGGRLEYHEMQTSVTYEHAPGEWKVALPVVGPCELPRTLTRLVQGKPLSIVLLGDSISTGCNASGWADGAPFQPAYPELLRAHLAAKFRTQVDMTNLSVGGTDTAWGLTQIDKVLAAKPDLVLIAFGMNDSAGRSAADFQANVRKMMAKLREGSPNVEIVLIAGMIGNRDWTRLKHERFTEYRDGLEELLEPGVALADLTSIWIEFLTKKLDWDLTGNGVNHPNDFGHRVYAQVLGAVIAPER